ncbi:MAG: hypothetical protein Q9160_003301 [Pyrenula sp. 1 TL-2023]
MTTPSALVFGSTGAVGSNILTTLLSTDTFPSIQTISRRLPTPQSAKLSAIQEADTSKWGNMISSMNPKPSTIFNAVGTTRSQAGGLSAQWAIDHDLCVENARAAKDAGVSTYVFVSSAGTRGMLSGFVPYSRMKVGVEDAVRGLGFENAIVLRPGAILGEREVPKAPVVEWVIGRLDRDQKIIGRAAVAAVRLAQEGKAPSRYWVLEQADIVKYGRDEWRE